MSTDPRVDEERAELERLRLVVDEDVTYREIEAKIRDGSFTLRAIGGNEGGNPAFKVFAAVMLSLLLGDENEMPPNYRMIEFSVKPAGEVDEICCSAEVLTRDGKTSHALRRELESQLSALRDAARDVLAAYDEAGHFSRWGSTGSALRFGSLVAAVAELRAALAKEEKP